MRKSAKIFYQEIYHVNDVISALESLDKTSVLQKQASLFLSMSLFKTDTKASCLCELLV